MGDQQQALSYSNERYGEGVIEPNYKQQARDLLKKLEVFNSGITSLAMLLAIRDNPLHSRHVIGQKVGMSGCVTYKAAERLVNSELIVSDNGRLLLTLRGKDILEMLEHVVKTEPIKPKIKIDWEI